MPTIETLSQTHPEFDRERLHDLVALYRGGKCFTKRVERFLPQNEYEAQARYSARLSSARYFNYIGPIIDRFAAALIQAPPSIGKTDGDVDEFWKDWQADVDGCGSDLSEFAREAITDAMMKGKTFFVVEKPTGDAATMAEWNDRGLGNVTVRELETQDVIDWACDESGRLEWLIHHECKSPRRAPTDKRKTIVETWTVYGRESTDVYSIEYEQNNRPGVEVEVPLVESRPNPLGRVPVVMFEVSEGMWLAERAYDAQVEHFVERSALSWALKASCYAMPVFHLEDGNMPPTMGVGNGLMLGANDKVDYLAPPSAPFEVVASSVESCREELYRIVHQMADGVSSRASATARSGTSKLADHIATNTILEAYSVVLRDALLRVVDLACALRGEDVEGYSIEGLDEFAAVDLKDLFDSAEKADKLGMPSDTFQAKMREMLVSAMLPQLPEQERQKIFEELAKGVQELREKDELEAEYQKALAHAVRTGETGERPTDAAAHAGDNLGGAVSSASRKGPAAKPDRPGLAKPGSGSARDKR